MYGKMEKRKKMASFNYVTGLTVLTGVNAKKKWQKWHLAA